VSLEVEPSEAKEITGEQVSELGQHRDITKSESEIESERDRESKSASEIQSESES